MDRPRPRRPVASSAADRKLIREIDSIGWTIMYITGNAPSPDFGFTIGLFEKFAHPEIVVVGMDREGTSWLLTRIAEQIRDGRRFDAIHEFDSVLQNNYQIRFKEVKRNLYPDNLGTARWFYQGANFPVLQAFIPDVHGRFPWEEAYEGDSRAHLLRGDSFGKRNVKS